MGFESYPITVQPEGVKINLSTLSKDLPNHLSVDVRVKVFSSNFT